MNLFKTLTSKKLLLILIAATIVLYVLNIFLLQKSIPKSVTGIPTPTPQFVWKEYTDKSQHYFLPVPPQWQKETPPVIATKETAFDFTQNGKTYAFTISQPGNIIPDQSLMTPTTNVFSQDVMYGKKHFIKRIYTDNTIPFFVVALPNEPDFTFYTFSMQLPQENYMNYLTVFDQILNRMVVEKSLEINTTDQLSPTSAQ